MRPADFNFTPVSASLRRRLHADTLTSIRVALRADPGRFEAAAIAEAMAALTTALGGVPVLSKANGISQAEVARLLSCSRWSIRRLVAAGKLRPVQLLGGLVRYDRQDVEALLSSAD